MQKIFKITAVALAIGGATSTARAAQKCVAFGEEWWICPTNIVRGSIDWNQQCSIKVNGGTKNITIRGFAVCASTNASFEYNNVSAHDSIEITGTDDMQCFCKITSPFTTKWIPARSRNGSMEDCADSCNASCNDAMNEYTPFRTKILSSIITE